jgi:hypothetical protein
MSAFHHPFFDLVHSTQHAIEGMVALFVFGTVLLALAGPRMEKLELEVAARPARAFALGIVSFVLAIAASVALAVTVIGIPFALCFVLVSVFATYAGIAAVLRTLGAALARHRTDNAYLHLALGCGLFLVASAIPWLGDFVTLGLALLGLGSVVASRLAGLWPPPKGATL